MDVDEYNWRPIAFQGEIFPPALMGISVLEPILQIEDEDLADWLSRLPICCGLTKSAPASLCVRCARAAVDLLIGHRLRVLDGIRERLATHGFAPEATYRDWLLALQRIAELSSVADGDCHWSAPMHPRDKFKTAADVQGFLRALSPEAEKP